MNCCENEEKPAVWPPKQLEDSDREYNDDLYGSFGKLSLSIGKGMLFDTSHKDWIQCSTV